MVHVLPSLSPGTDPSDHIAVAITSLEGLPKQPIEVQFEGPLAQPFLAPFLAHGLSDPRLLPPRLRGHAVQSEASPVLGAALPSLRGESRGCFPRHRPSHLHHQGSVVVDAARGWHSLEMSSRDAVGYRGGAGVCRDWG